MFDDLPITASAREHGISDADIYHALRNVSTSYTDQGEVDMFIGAARDGTMLEVGVTWNEPRKIIHAMKVRTKYWPVRKGQRR